MKRLFTLALAFATVASLAIFPGLHAAAPATGRVSGAVRQAGTDGPVRFAQVRIEGAGLTGRENNQIIQKVGTDGRYRFDVPAGAYELWASAPDHEETLRRVEVSAGAALQIDLSLPPLQASPYRVETVPLPRQMVGELSGVAFTPTGTLVVTTRRGEVWTRTAEGYRWRRFAAGLYEPFGVVAPADDEILVIQRPEITRLRDRDGDGVADEFATVADDWGITGSYHEFSYGLARDRAGNLYASSGLCSFGRGVELPWVRGPLQTAQYLPWPGPGAVPDGHRSVALYQGWAFRVSPEGRFETFASGFRQPLGVGVSPDDELFISDCAGAWVPTSTFTHVERGGFYGHADSLKWHPEFKDRRLGHTEITALRRPPSVYLPRGVLGTSPGQPTWDTTGGRFGPFGGQVFMGDVSAILSRIDLERVAGAWQGAAFPFLRGGGLRLGGMHQAFGPDGALYLAQTVRGWMPTGGNEGLQRIVWNGSDPVEVLTLRLAARGFTLGFTVPMGATAGQPANYRVQRFRYLHHPLDGSLRVDNVEVPVTAARLVADGRTLELELLELQPGHVHELTVDAGVTDRTGRPLLNRVAYYNVNRLLSGETQPGPTRLAVAPPAALRAGDARAGTEVYRQNCLVCHPADGRGSREAGTPDYTLPSGLRAKSDAELIRIVAEGRVPAPPAVNPMPPWGNVLTEQSIRDVVAYLRASFGDAKP
ncbi:MAG: c-type cytochrome [Opitutaceae bacterium]